ncbi:MAG: GMP synthase [Thaumarchaeota archaeon]|nr:MAG: GMP synthase [Nitrososphaerota archaeon]
MLKLLLVNNYDAANRERMLTLKASLARGGRVEVTDWNLVTSEKLREYDGVILSGSYDMLSSARTQAKFAREIDAMKDHGGPALGVCFGHQLLGHAFGSRVVRAANPAKGYRDAEVLRHDPLFRGLPHSIGVYESHREEVESLPAGFAQLARSSTAEICAMKHSGLPIYGVQFHPERYSLEKPDGEVILANFVEHLVKD